MKKSKELARWLVQRAARSAPPALSDRLEEEWLADLEARKGVIARLRLAAGCFWATRVIAQEHCAASVAAAASGGGSKTMTAYAQYDGNFLSRRTVPLLLIIGLHLAIIYAFATGLTRHAFNLLPERMQAFSLPDVRPTRPSPPLPIDVHTQPLHTIQIDDPVIPIGPVETDHTPQVVGPAVVDPLPPAPPPRAVKRVLGGPGKGFPHTEDYYPPGALRLGQQGAAIVETCIDEKGLLTAAPTLIHSSGTASLDEGALKLAKAGSGHYRPTTEDGQPVRSCYQFLVTFHVND